MTLGAPQLLGEVNEPLDHLRGGGCLARIPLNPYTVSVRPEAIVFDLINTLLERNDSVSHASVQAMCADPDYARKRIPQIVPGEDLDRGTVTFRQLHELLVDEVGLEADYETFVAASMSGYGPAMNGVETILDALAGDYQPALLSNLNAVDWAYCKTHHRALLAKVEPHFVPFQLGMIKPDPEIYRHVANALGMSPSECLLVDDGLANVEGARLTGRGAIHFTSAEQLRHQLAASGIL